MTREGTAANIREWLVEPYPRDVATSIDRLSRAEDVQHIAIMPDIHLAQDVCVGVTVATKHLLYPAAIGSDIGCGMLAVQFDTGGEVLRHASTAAQVMASLYEWVPSLKQPRASALQPLPEILRDTPLSDPRLERLKSREAVWQLGTLGRGNHFLELQVDEEDQLWLMLHSGSRALGQAIARHHLSHAAVHKSKGLAFLDADSSAGQAYLSDVGWATQYAAENRLAMMTAVARVLGELCGTRLIPSSLIHANHNHVRREIHFGEPYWVHRKGALWASAGEAGVIPGSMGSASFHVAGRGCAESLHSSSHGAGRTLSRADASRTIRPRDLEREMKNIWIEHRRLRYLCDESPSAYKNIYAVMRAQRELTRIVRTLQPRLCRK